MSDQYPPYFILTVYHVVDESMEGVNALSIYLSIYGGV